MTLDELAIGKTGTIQAVRGEGALRLRLLDMGLIPKTKVKMIKVAPLGDPIEIFVKGCHLALRREEAEAVEVAPCRRDP